MANLLAPYTNAMRIGQGSAFPVRDGFLNDPLEKLTFWHKLVSIPTPSKSASTTLLVLLGPAKLPAPDRARFRKFLVTYNSRQVDKVSDVADAMNISGAFSVKTGGVSGSANGSYIDTNKLEQFKESDFNFLLQVKVINQTTIYTEKYTFNDIEQKEVSPEISNAKDLNDQAKPTKGPKDAKDAKDSKDPKDPKPTPPSAPAQTFDFTGIFGDTFISGFTEGGEFNALISIKVLDKEKATAIRAHVEAELKGGAASGHVDFGLDKSDIQKNQQTTISVSWSGGGQIKEPKEPWSMATVIDVASRFPQLCADSPQKTNLREYVKKKGIISPLNYENAGVYTSELLDAYMDYKNSWKNINQILDEPEKYMKNPVQITLPTGVTGDVTAFPVNAVSLQQAREDARKNMTKIVLEIDEVTRKPSVASDIHRPTPYSSPDIFRARLPVVKPPPPVPSKKTTAPGGLYTGDLTTLQKPERDHIEGIAKDLGLRFRLDPPVGTVTDGVFFSHLTDSHVLNSKVGDSIIPTELVGIRNNINKELTYLGAEFFAVAKTPAANANEDPTFIPSTYKIETGAEPPMFKDGEFKRTVELMGGQVKGTVDLKEEVIKKTVDLSNMSAISAITISLDSKNIQDASRKPIVAVGVQFADGTTRPWCSLASVAVDDVETKVFTPPKEGYEFRGLWGFTNKDGYGIQRLGVIWGL
ncbi:hypothetical protein EDC01DRAFT_746176 [Geopyxis carbonaria]|nr:hypothetical protein EDC01DRAFT_746176 [Geopyxis carbonaria]